MHMERSAGVVVFHENGRRRYLLLLYGEGHWDYIKGHMEQGEDEIQTATREAAEETGLETLEFIDGFRKPISYFFKRRSSLVSKEVIFLLAKTQTETVSLSFEHKNYLWLPFEEAIQKLTFKNARDVLEESEEFLKKIHAQRKLEDFS
jgi:8-oxo-dGTP pyrophosphatase MutT (NUDIX family)